MAFQIIMTPEMLLYLTLGIDNAVATLISRIGKMSPEEINAGIIVEEGRKKQLMERVDAH